MTDEAHAQQLREDATALLRTAEVAAFFAAVAENEADAEQARHDENTLNRWAAFNRQLADA